MHPHRADVEAHFLEFLDADVGRHFAQANREERAFHLAGQHDFQAVPRAFVAEDAQVVLRLIDGQKERQALDVVPVGMREQQSQVERLVVELGDQLAPQQPQSRAGVEDDDLAIGADLDAGGVAAVMDGGRARGWEWSRARPRTSAASASGRAKPPDRTCSRGGSPGGAARLVLIACGGLHGSMWRTLAGIVAQFRLELKLKCIESGPRLVLLLRRTLSPCNRPQLKIKRWW